MEWSLLRNCEMPASAGGHQVVETDGYRFHRGRAAFEDDKRRDLRLRALGFDVLHLTYDQVTREAELAAGIIRKLLAAT
jgi:very-short-patch-repair endonuclease